MTTAAYFTRTEYLAAAREDGPAAHRRYYAQFVNASVIRFVGSSVGIDKIKASTDRHMNDIPLALWDRMHKCLPLEPGIFQKITGSNSYSLSDSVCIAKEAARQIAERA